MKKQLNEEAPNLNDVITSPKIIKTSKTVKLAIIEYEDGTAILTEDCENITKFERIGLYKFLESRTAVQLDEEIRQASNDALNSLIS
jgi:hypothetical protein